MIPKIFHQSSKYFTWAERRLAKRAQTFMPEWTYHAWTDEDNLALVEKIFPGNVKDYVRLPHGGSKVDIARYLYMYQYGGIYFDTDFRFFRAINEDLLSSHCILGVEQQYDPYVSGGPNGKRLDELVNGNGTSQIMIVWDHGRTPGCANSAIAAPRGPFKPYVGSPALTHYPTRHTGVFNVLFCDGHVASMTQPELVDQFFYAFGHWTHSPVSP